MIFPSWSGLCIICVHFSPLVTPLSLFLTSRLSHNWSFCQDHIVSLCCFFQEALLDACRLGWSPASGSAVPLYSLYPIINLDSAVVCLPVFLSYQTVDPISHWWRVR